ncbi:MAG: T9SS type A sorting domain-containing protein [Gemmatimonadaceae bacterium]|nr:T9SS type A sorting domain-containing protein [Gemmatimonadaceae bacterium]
MNATRRTASRLRLALLPLSLSLPLPLHAQDGVIDFALSRIDTGEVWVSPYFGYNGPKLVFDGDDFYAVGMWGLDPSTAKGVVYRGGEEGWERFYDWGTHDYQPGLVLLDSERRLVLVHPRLLDGPRILHQQGRGDPDSFEEVALPAGLGKAGYVGAAMDGDRLILGYIADPATYSFLVAWVDLDTGEWGGPHLLAREQRAEEPYTTWLYPVIWPDGDGFHLVVSNNGDLSGYYNRINYLYVPYADPLSAEVEVVADVVPWTQNIAYAEAMWKGADGALYLTGQYEPEGGNNRLMVYRRDPETRQWEETVIGGAAVAAVYETQARPGELWMAVTHGSALLLYRAEEGGREWTRADVASFDGHGLQSLWFLYGISPTSGSVLPDGPCAVFSSGPHPNLELWFVRFRTAPPTAVSGLGEATPRASRLDPAYPNPFNAGTVLTFEIGRQAEVDLRVHDLLGRPLVTLRSERMAPGRYRARWDGTLADGGSLGSGVYILRLRVGGDSYTRKVMVLR